MANVPLVSIVIPHYNYESYLEECLSSCCAQKEVQDGKAEVVVVDDCSDEDPRFILKHFPIRWIRLSENAGYSTAKNEGIKIARGDLIVHLDADDCLTPNSLKVRLAEFEKDPHLDLVHALAWRYRNGDIDGYNKKAKIHAQTVMIKRSVYERFGLYYEGLRSKSDKEMWYRLGIHPRSPFRPRIKAKKIKEFVALYRKHDEQMHKVRKANPATNNAIETVFKKRIEQLRREGLTKDNTGWL